MQVRKGEPFTVKVVAVDQVGHLTYTRIFSSVSSADSSLDRCCRVWIGEACSDITYTIRTPFETEQVTLFADGPC